MSLLDDVRNELDITWEDSDLDSKLTRYINSSKSRIDELGGTEFDYDSTGKHLDLLMARVRYMRWGALNEFEKDYLSDINALIIQERITNANREE